MPSLANLKLVFNNLVNGRSVAPSCEDEVVGQPLNFQFSFSSQIFTHPTFPAGRWQYFQSIQISAKTKLSEVFLLQSLNLKLTNLHFLYDVILKFKAHVRQS